MTELPPFELMAVISQAAVRRAGLGVATHYELEVDPVFWCDVAPGLDSGATEGFLGAIPTVRRSQPLKGR